MPKNRPKQPKTDISDISNNILELYTNDCQAHAKDCIKIRDHNTSEIVSLIYNPSQKILHEIAERQKKETGIVRVMLLKSRRFGGSTYIQGRFYSKTSLEFNRNTFIVAHERESTNTLFDMAKLMQERNPIAPSIKANNEKCLRFDNEDKTGLKSDYRLASADNPDAGRSQGVHFLHCSEEAFWRDGSTILTSLLQCLPDPPAYSEAFRESTANGYGNSFQQDVFASYGEGAHPYYAARLCDVAPHMPQSDVDFIFAWRNPTQDWILVFIPWFMHDRYSREFETDQHRKQFIEKIKAPAYNQVAGKWGESEELKLLRRYKLSYEQLYWMEWAIANKCRGSIDKFRQEYPATVEEAFLSQGTSVYPPELCNEIEQLCLNPLVVGDVVVREGKTRIRRNPNGHFSIWARPENDEVYFMTIDSGGGENKRQREEKTDPDPSCIDVYHHKSGKQVAQWHGHIAYDLLADVAEMIGNLYNKAMAVPELQNHGYTVVADLKRKSYPMYEWKPGEPGWSTNAKTKPVMVDDLYRFSRDGLIQIQSKATVSEMRTFKEKNGKYGAETGCHDERVDTAGMACSIMQLMPSRMVKSDNESVGFVTKKHDKSEHYEEFYANG